MAVGIKWVYLGCADLGTISGRCQLCGANLRYVHKLSDMVNELNVGVECCSNLLSNEDFKQAQANDEALKKSVRKEASHEQRIKKHYDQYSQYRAKRGLEVEPFESYRSRWLENEAKKKGD